MDCQIQLWVDNIKNNLQHRRCEMYNGLSRMAGYCEPLTYLHTYLAMTPVLGSVHNP